MRDILKDIAPLLGVLLTFLSALFAYRWTEVQKKKDIAEAAKPNLQVIGGALASVEGARMYVEEFQKLGQTGDKIAAGLHAVAAAISGASEAQTQRENDRLAQAVEKLLQAERDAPPKRT